MKLRKPQTVPGFVQNVTSILSYSLFDEQFNLENEKKQFNPLGNSDKINPQYLQLRQLKASL